MLLDLAKIAAEINLNINSIFHVGAHLAEELELYQQLNIKHVAWVEANPQLLSTLKEKLKGIENHTLHNYYLSNEQGKRVEFNITNNGQSSSGLDLKDHKIFYPDIKIINQIEIESTTADYLFNKNTFALSSYDLVVLDIQGSELNALRGMTQLLKTCQAIYTEINILELYRGVPTLKEIDLFLSHHNFKRTHMHLHKHGWGDAFYCRQPENETIKLDANEYFKLNRKYALQKIKRKIRNLIK